MGQLRFILVLVLCASWACSSQPRVGGQTGDPGVYEFTSLDADSPGGLGGGGGGSGSCAGVPPQLGERRALGDVQRRWLDDGHVVQLDPREGLAVVDVTGAAPRVSGRLPLPLSIGDLHIAGSRALIVRRNAKPFEAYRREGYPYPQLDDEAELIVVDLSDPERPLRSSSSALPEGVRLSHVVTRQGRTHLYVVSDGGTANGCVGSSVHALLAGYELIDDRLVPGASLELSPNGATFGVAQDNLVVVRRVREAAVPFRMSLVPLGEADGSLVEGSAVDLASRPFGVDATGGALRVLAQDSLLLFDIGDPRSPVRSAECALDFGEFYFSRVSFTARHALVTDFNPRAGNRAFSVAMREDGSCEVESRQGQARALVALTPSRVLDIERDEDGLHARLLDDADLSLIDEQSVAVSPELSDVGHNLGEDMLTRLALPGDADAEGVFGIALHGRSARGEPSSALQLFSFSSSALRARGALSHARPWVDAAGTSPAIVQLSTGLAQLDLAALDAPHTSEPLALSAQFSRAWAWDEHWVRVRLPDRAEPFEFDKHGLSDEALYSPLLPARLEVVEAGEQPSSEKVAASLEVNPLARFVRVGDLVVSIVTPLEGGPQPALMEVFDLDDPLHPRRRGELMASDLWLRGRLGRGHLGGPNDPNDCLDCAGADLTPRTLALPGALVFRSPEEADARTLRVLDLRDPDAPILYDELELPGGADVVSALSAGSSVYYAHRERAGEVSEDGVWHRARFYFGRVDLTDPGAPVFAPDVNVPGQLVAVDGARIFTREFYEQDGRVHTRLHRLSVRDGRAELRATHDFGDWLALSIAADGAGHLLADVQPPAELSSSAYDPPRGLVLHVLDGESLQPLGMGDVGRYGARLAARGDRLLYWADGGFVVMDLSDPTAPFARAWVPVFTLFQSGRGALTAGGALLDDGAGLMYLDAGFSNLPRP